MQPRQLHEKQVRRESQSIAQGLPQQAVRRTFERLPAGASPSSPSHLPNTPKESDTPDSAWCRQGQHRTRQVPLRPAETARPQAKLPPRPHWPCTSPTDGRVVRSRRHPSCSQRPPPPPPPKGPRSAGASLLWPSLQPVSYTHLRAHETKANLVCRLLLEKKKK